MLSYLPENDEDCALYSLRNTCPMDPQYADSKMSRDVLALQHRPRYGYLSITPTKNTFFGILASRKVRLI